MNIQQSVTALKLQNTSTNTTRNFCKCSHITMVSLFFYFVLIVRKNRLSGTASFRIYVNYEILKDHQMFLFSDMENKRYLLKAPDHLMHIETILDVFPEATFIFTFRRLSQIIPSFCALILVMNEQFGGTVNEKWKKRFIFFILQQVSGNISSLIYICTLNFEYLTEIKLIKIFFDVSGNWVIWENCWCVESKPLIEWLTQIARIQCIPCHTPGWCQVFIRLLSDVFVWKASLT